MLACFYDLGAAVRDLSATVDPIPHGRDYLDSAVSGHVAQTPATPAHVRVAYQPIPSNKSSAVGFKTTA